MEFPKMLEDYIEFRIDPTNRQSEDSKFCSAHSISLGTLQELKKGNPGWAKDLLARSRDERLSEMLYVDDGVINQAKGGNVKAAELAYERVEGYVRPKTPIQVGVMVNLAGALKDAYQNRITDDGPDDATKAITVTEGVAEGSKGVH